VAELKAKLAVVPSRDGALGVIGVSGNTGLIDIDILYASGLYKNGPWGKPRL
jgi:hypothetical protein